MDEADVEMDKRPVEIDKRFVAIAKAQGQDVENIRALARIAEIHEHRLTDLEDQRQ